MSLARSDPATLDDIRCAVTTLEATERTTRRVFGGARLPQWESRPLCKTLGRLRASSNILAAQLISTPQPTEPPQLLVVLVPLRPDPMSVAFGSVATSLPQTHVNFASSSPQLHSLSRATTVLAGRDVLAASAMSLYLRCGPICFAQPLGAWYGRVLADDPIFAIGRFTITGKARHDERRVRPERESQRASPALAQSQTTATQGPP